MERSKHIVVLVVVFVVLMLSFVCSNKEVKNEIVLVAGAIRQLYIDDNWEKFDLLSFADPKGESVRRATIDSNTLADKVIRDKPDSVAVEVKTCDSKHPWNCALNISTILIFDSLETFNDAIVDIKWVNNMRMRYKHLVYVPNLNLTNVSKRSKQKFSIDKIGFLTNLTTDSIELATSFMFTKEICRWNQLVTVNSFTTHAMEWESSVFYPQKYKNLHGCELLVGTGRLNTLKTHIFETMKTLSEQLNFEMNIKEIEIMPDQTRITCRECDLLLKISKYNGDKNYITSVSIMSEKISFIVPPGQLYTPLEKMFLMFDEDLWIAIGGTLMIALVVIQVINRTKPTVKEFVFGRLIQTPTLNLISIFLNGGQSRSPKRNMARFLVVMFVIWSLIIRTCYQSELFKYLQNDIRKPSIKTADEIVLSNYTFLCTNPLSGARDFLESIGKKYFTIFKLGLK